MKGEVRNPTTVWLLSLFTCNLYGAYFVFMANTELKNYLGKEDLNPVVEAIIYFCCFPFAVMRLGANIQAAQVKAGMANAENQGVTFAIWSLIFYLGFKKMQEELNKVWESGGGAPATF